MTHREGWAWVLALAAIWGVGPMLPALVAGQIPGTPWTDLYPSVWGLGWFASHITGVIPTFADELGAPHGVPFYYSSPLHGWLAALTVPIIGLSPSYSLGIALARVATVACAYGAGRAVGLTAPGAITTAAVYGASPFFHGFAVEGIIEGTDGWTLALWIWMAAEQRLALATVAGALTVLSSWYLGLCGCLLAAGCAIVAALPPPLGLADASPRPALARAAVAWFGGLACATPALWLFFSAFSGGAPLDPAIRAAMGTSLDALPRPGALAGTHPFAKTSWIGAPTLILAAVEARRSPRLAVAAVLLWVLSLGVGPVYSLPLWRAIRFPYRIHAATLFVLGVLAGRAVDGPSALPARLRAFATIALIAVGGWLMSPIEPVLPGSPADVSPGYAGLRGKLVLAIPGPVAMPPGKVNRSRERAKYLLYDLAIAGTRTPWVFDWNSVGSSGVEAPALAAVRTWDRLYDGDPKPIDVAALRQIGVAAIVIHRDALGDTRADALAQSLQKQGATPAGGDPTLERWDL